LSQTACGDDWWFFDIGLRLETTMNIDSIDQVIAERRYMLSGEQAQSYEVIVRLGAPQKRQEHDFFCPFEIVGVGDSKIRYGAGADAFQALQLTLKMIGVNLYYYRQQYGPGFYLNEQGDDLGFPEEAWTEGIGHQIVRAFGAVYGLKLSIERNAGSMKNFQFGAIRPDPSWKGTIGQFALHIQCPWRLVSAHSPWLPPRIDLMVTGSGDWWEPAERTENVDWDAWNKHRTTPSVQQKALEALFTEYDVETESYIFRSLSCGTSRSRRLRWAEYPFKRRLSAPSFSERENCRTLAALPAKE
jgi:hypothetical protein